MEIGTREQLPRRADKLINERVVVLASDPLLLQAEVQLVVEEVLVIGPAVENDGQDAVGVNARADGRQEQLGDGDQDAADALVTDPEDFLPV